MIVAATARPDPDDRVIAGRAAAGDREAFADLIRRYRPRALAWAARIVESSADAPDVVQEVFLRVFRGLPEYRGESKFSVWLYRIAFHASLSWNARHHRREELLPESGSPLMEDTRPSPESLAAGRESGARVAAAVAALPLTYRTVVVLHYWRGMTYEEISAHLNVPLNTIKTHLRRAKHRLRQALERPM